ncbi:MAG: hypothetical protein J7M21_02905 [Planctomycetes bacterium]|nr:hypothetical protein [Planctomycetota bacterium]
MDGEGPECVEWFSGRMVRMGWIAARQTAASNFSRVLVGAALLSVLVLAGAVFIRWVRRRFHPSAGSSGGSSSGGVFSIESLETMLGRGEISREEFRVLRRAALGLPVKDEKTPSSVSSGPAGADDEVDDGGQEAASDTAEDGAGERSARRQEQSPEEE